MSQPGKAFNPAALRRSTRLTISVPVTVTGQDSDGKTFTEQTSTVGVNKHGGKITLNHAVRLKDPLTVTNAKLGITARAVVAWLGEHRSPAQPWEVGIALTEPQNIWGIDFPPQDWGEPRSWSRRAAQGSEESASSNAAASVPAALVAEERAPAVAAVAREVVPAAPAGPLAVALPEPPPAVAASAAVPAPQVVASSSGNGNGSAAAAVPVFSAEQLEAATQEIVTKLSEQMKRMAEAHAKVFHQKLADLAVKHSESTRKELENVASGVLEDGTAKLHRRAQRDLEDFAQHLEELRHQVSTDTLRALRHRLAALLATLDSPSDPNLP